MKHLKNFALIVFSFLMSMNLAHSSPWAAVGDKSLRNDVETLAHYGLVSGPVNTWPMPWKQITANLHKADSMNLPMHVRLSLARVRAKIPTEINGSSRAAYTNEPELIRGFDKSARNEIDIEGAVELNLDSGTTIHVQGGYRSGNGQDYEHLDGSYISQDIGNWALYSGAVDRWWGPGQESTLILSNNARPMPSIGLRRLEAKPFETKLLSWMGPWSWDMFVAKMEKDRHISKPVFVGMRLSFTPIEGFDVGLSRTLQLCGEGRACNFSTWTKALISVGDLDNPSDRTDLSQEPGNQLASIDLSYSLSVGEHDFLKIYAEGTAEDLLVFLPYEYARLVGLSYTSSFNNGGNVWKVNVEYSDTIATLVWFGGRRRDHVLYNHHIYRTGYRYKNKALGHSLDTNSKLVTIGAEYKLENNIEMFVKLHHAIVNKNGDNFYRSSVSANEEEINLVEAGVSSNLHLGKIQLVSRLYDNNPNSPDQNNTGVDIEFSFGIDF